MRVVEARLLAVLLWRFFFPSIWAEVGCSGSG